MQKLITTIKKKKEEKKRKVMKAARPQEHTLKSKVTAKMRGHNITQREYLKF